MFKLPEDRTYFIAEAGVNHNGDIALALELVKKVSESGADAIKFQTFVSAGSVVSQKAPSAKYMVDNTGITSQYELLENLRLELSEFEVISKACKEAGITFLSTPFDTESMKFLASLGMPFVKIPSGEITNSILLRSAAFTGLPLIISTGMTNLIEINEALSVIRSAWVEMGLEKPEQPWISLLHCVSSYPAPYDSVNLKSIQLLTHKFNLQVGFSDHTIGTCIPIAAVAMGARVIEKHVTLDCSLKGPDHAASLSVDDLPKLISDIRAVESAFGYLEKKPQAVESNTKQVARRSLIAVKNIKKGELFTRGLLTALRPGTGISPMKIELLLGCPALRDYCAGELIDTKEVNCDN
jgi:N,N'-diacetyllegionaminate synthase